MKYMIWKHEGAWGGTNTSQKETYRDVGRDKPQQVCEIGNLILLLKVKREREKEENNSAWAKVLNGFELDMKTVTFNFLFVLNFVAKVVQKALKNNYRSRQYWKQEPTSSQGSQGRERETEGGFGSYSWIKFLDVFYSKFADAYVGTIHQNMSIFQCRCIAGCKPRLVTSLHLPLVNLYLN